jgi:hypothetical protein
MHSLIINLDLSIEKRYENIVKLFDVKAASKNLNEIYSFSEIYCVCFSLIFFFSFFSLLFLRIVFPFRLFRIQLGTFGGHL